MLGRKVAHRKRSWKLQHETRVCLSPWACRVEPVIVWSINSKNKTSLELNMFVRGIGQDPYS